MNHFLAGLALGILSAWFTILGGCSSAQAGPPWETTSAEISPSVYFFRHSGNECYVVRGVGVSCVKGTP